MIRREPTLALTDEEALELVVAGADVVSGADQVPLHAALGRVIATAMVEAARQASAAIEFSRDTQPSIDPSKRTSR
jgi:hypothetical protein